MKLRFANDRVAIYDDVLPSDDFDRLWVCVQNDQYRVPEREGAWIKVWRLNDGPSLSSKEYLYSRNTSANHMDVVFRHVIELARRHPNIVGKESETWTDISLRSYLYPRGGKLSWHDDTGIYCGELVYYTHPEWGSTWGGELLIADTDASRSIRDQAIVGPYMDHRWEDRYVLDAGLGMFVSPKPNRLVLLAEGLYHAINRVDADAGDNIRCSITGFFKRAPSETAGHPG